MNAIERKAARRSGPRCTTTGSAIVTVAAMPAMVPWPAPIIGIGGAHNAPVPRTIINGSVGRRVASVIRRGITAVICRRVAIVVSVAGVTPIIAVTRPVGVGA